MTAEADAILDEAYRILSEEKGWCQGDASISAWGHLSPTADENARAVCVLGALHLARLHVGPSLYLARTEAEHRLYLALGEPDDLADWNDDPHTTKEDVLLALKGARYDFGDES